MDHRVLRFARQHRRRAANRYTFRLTHLSPAEGGEWKVVHERSGFQPPSPCRHVTFADADSSVTFLTSQSSIIHAVHGLDGLRSTAREDRPFRARCVALTGCSVAPSTAPRLPLTLADRSTRRPGRDGYASGHRPADPVGKSGERPAAAADPTADLRREGKAANRSRASTFNGSQDCRGSDHVLTMTLLAEPPRRATNLIKRLWYYFALDTTGDGAMD